MLIALWIWKLAEMEMLLGVSEYVYKKFLKFGIWELQCET